MEIRIRERVLTGDIGELDDYDSEQAYEATINEVMENYVRMNIRTPSYYPYEVEETMKK